MQDVTPAIPNGGRKYVQTPRLLRIDIEKHGPARKIILHALPNILSNAFKQRVARRYPFEGRIICQ